MLPKKFRILYQKIIIRNLNINCQLSDKTAGNVRELPGNCPGITYEILRVIRSLQIHFLQNQLPLPSAQRYGIQALSAIYY